MRVFVGVSTIGEGVEVGEVFFISSLSILDFDSMDGSTNDTDLDSPVELIKEAA
jgi:hypothetical protein